MRTAFSLFLALALTTVPWKSPLSVMAPIGAAGVTTAVMAAGSVKMVEASVLDTMIGGTTMNWCVAMVGAAIGGGVFSLGIGLGFAFVWAATCWSGG